MGHEKTKFKTLIRVVYLIGALELLVCAYLYLRINPTIINTLTLATTIKPQPFTEVYFQNHTQLPTIVLPGRQYSFTFTIRNHENKDMEYPYDMYIEQDGEKQYIDHNSVTLKNNESITIQEGFLFTKPLTRAKVAISLLNKNQQVDFLIKGSQIYQ